MRISLKAFLIFLLVFASLIPDIGIKFSTMGFNWTLYRIVIVVGILRYLQLPKNKEKMIARFAYRRWVLLMTGWVCYGTILLVISPYRDPHKGFVELLSIFGGLICILVLTSVLQEAYDLEQIISVVQCVFLALVILGCFECATGFHLPMSYFHDGTVTHLGGRRAATGVFYSENDFSSFLTCFMPVMLYGRRGRTISFFSMIGVLYVDYINDANICLIAIIIAISFYLIFIKKYGKNGRKVVSGMLIVLGCIVVVYVWNNLKDLSNVSTLIRTIYVQYSSMALSEGSLYARLVIYADSLKAALHTAFLGIGPAAFSNYFYAHPSLSGLVNPHNLYLEMLVEYGLVITGAFIFEIFKMIHTLRKKAIMCSNKGIRLKYIVGCEMLVLYCFVCIASSSFIGYAWQWIVMTIGIALVGTPEEKLGYYEKSRGVLFAVKAASYEF